MGRLLPRAKKNRRAEARAVANGDRGARGSPAVLRTSRGGVEVFGGRGGVQGARFWRSGASGPCVQRRATPGFFGLHVRSTAAPATSGSGSTATRTSPCLLYQCLPFSALLPLSSTTSTFLLFLCLFSLSPLIFWLGQVQRHRGCG